ncbi:MAG: hypothetical protein MPN21_14085 [Thermoanaerobaculia bacterium]|nr:hypothetical protein [Thermoanaerobaculia bacterium]
MSSVIGGLSLRVAAVRRGESATITPRPQVANLGVLCGKLVGVLDEDIVGLPRRRYDEE